MQHFDREVAVAVGLGDAGELDPWGLPLTRPSRRIRGEGVVEGVLGADCPFSLS